MRLKPIHMRHAREFLAKHHRHHPRLDGWKFGIGLQDDEGELVGIAAVGRPVAQKLDDGFTAEVRRVCTDGTPNACSMLYGAAWRAAKAMGYTRMITYTTFDEPGTSLRAAGWTEIGVGGGVAWNMPNRKRTEPGPVQKRRVWEVRA